MKSSESYCAIPSDLVILSSMGKISSETILFFALLKDNFSGDMLQRDIIEWFNWSHYRVSKAADELVKYDFLKPVKEYGMKSYLFVKEPIPRNFDTEADKQEFLRLKSRRRQTIHETPVQSEGFVGLSDLEIWKGVLKEGV